MNEPANVTVFLALYGAFLSSIVFGWNLFRDLKDRPRLKLTAHVRRLAQSTDGKWYAVKPDLPVEGASEELFIVMHVTNTGRRPVMWTGWGGKYHQPVNGKDSYWITPRTIPIMLKEGEFHSEHTEWDGRGENIKRLYIWDAAGKEWDLSWRAFRKLKAEFRKYAETDTEAHAAGR